MNTGIFRAYEGGLRRGSDGASFPVKRARGYPVAWSDSFFPFPFLFSLSFSSLSSLLSSLSLPL